MLDDLFFIAKGGHPIPYYCKKQPQVGSHIIATMYLCQNHVPSLSLMTCLNENQNAVKCSIILTWVYPLCIPIFLFFGGTKKNSNKGVVWLPIEIDINTWM